MRSARKDSSAAVLPRKEKDLWCVSASLSVHAERVSRVNTFRHARMQPASRACSAVEAGDGAGAHANWTNKRSARQVTSARTLPLSLSACPRANRRVAHKASNASATARECRHARGSMAATASNPPALRTRSASSSMRHPGESGWTVSTNAAPSAPTALKVSSAHS